MIVYQPGVAIMAQSSGRTPYVLCLSALAVVCLLIGCSTPPSPAIRQQSQLSAVDNQSQWQRCIKDSVDQSVSDAWAGYTEDYPLISSQKIIEKALRKCIPIAFTSASCHDPAYGYGYFCDGAYRYPEIFAQDTYNKAQEARDQAYQIVQKAITSSRQSENMAKLMRDEPGVLSQYRICIFSNAASLAIISQETADVVASASYAACRQQRVALIDLHRRYGDTSFTDTTMDEVEKRLVGALVLTVIKARAARQIPSPVPPALNPPQAPERRSI